MDDGDSTLGSTVGGGNNGWRWVAIVLIVLVILGMLLRRTLF